MSLTGISLTANVLMFIGGSALIWFLYNQNANLIKSNAETENKLNNAEYTNEVLVDDVESAIEGLKNLNLERIQNRRTIDNMKKLNAVARVEKQIRAHPGLVQKNLDKSIEEDLQKFRDAFE